MFFSAMMFMFCFLTVNAQDKPAVKLIKQDSVNIKQLQDAIVFEGERKRSFDGLICVWYAMARKKGLPPERAYMQTLNKVAVKVLELSYSINDPR